MGPSCLQGEGLSLVNEVTVYWFRAGCWGPSRSQDLGDKGLKRAKAVAQGSKRVKTGPKQPQNVRLTRPKGAGRGPGKSHF